MDGRGHFKSPLTNRDRLCFRSGLKLPQKIPQGYNRFNFVKHLFLITFDFMQRDDQFPLAPYTDTVNYNDLSPFNKTLLKKHCPRDYRNKRYSSQKLLATFYPRRKYVVLLDNLKYHLRRGLKLTKIRRAVKFTQKDFLKNFITKIKKLRSEAKTDFELRSNCLPIPLSANL